MPITTSYPGIYIEELPNTSHTITAAPTSIAVFVGYSHPLKTSAPFGTAVQVFSPTDYERSLGGFFDTPDRYSDPNFSSLAQAVNQFFLNGGSQAYVVGLELSYLTEDSSVPPVIKPNAFIAQTVKAGGVNFMAREITGDKAIQEDSDFVMNITVSNVRQTANPNDTADIKVTYGSQAEIFRNVNLIADPKSPDFINSIQKRIGTANSSLIAVPSAQVLPATFAEDNQSFAPTITVDDGFKFKQFFAPSDFIEVFKQDSSLDKLPIFNLMALPGVTDGPVLSEALAFCERKRALFIMDPPSNTTADPGATYVGDYMTNTAPQSPNGALYFPYLKATNPRTNQPVNLPPSGYVAGIYSRTDQNRGVWKAPAGLETTVHNTSGVVDSGRMNDMRHGDLNPRGVNCLRSFPGSGTVVFGARTLVTANLAFEQWRYVPVRRMALFIEQTLFINLTWVVFEPNDEPLWIAIRTSIERFMLSLFRQGAFQGSTPSQAFQVQCDHSTTTQEDVNNGIVNIIVAFAPLKPAEFVVVKIAQLAGQVQA
jgi:hypothetical protein